MTKLANKRNLSSTQVMKTLQILMQGNFSMKEIIEKLNEKEEYPLFNNGVISKYINTCRFCGIHIPKINNKYYVAKIPFGLDMSDDEVDLLKFIQEYVKNEMSAKKTNIINSFFEKISHFSNKEIRCVEKDSFNLAVELFERAISRKRKINLIFKNGKKLTCIPINITNENGKKWLHIYEKKERIIDSSRLSGVEITGQKYIEEPFFSSQKVVYKLTDGLAARYSARENETVTRNVDGSIIVTNESENKETLFARLLRYDDKCEILQPKKYREEMKNLICDTLSNYEVD